ncbi:MAG: EamA family transporter RarD [Propionibacteriaceae bacterium]|nr:EamA family transporter RarD [Propionibacteriaceae bacterium]
MDSRGVLLALAAYGLWGVFPFYFMLIGAAGPLEIVGHRVVWSLVFCLIGVLAWRALPEFRAVLRSPRLRTGLVLAGVLVSVNWLVYVWGVLNDHIVDTALGYFINPLFTVTLAVLVLRERLRPAQWAAVGIGAVAVIVIAIGYGRVPWVALALATSFGLYGLAKNRVGGKVSPLVGLTVETGGLTPVALGYLIWLQVTATGTFTSHGPAHALLLAGAGIVTAVPLLLFAGAASRIPLSMMGLIQYVAPVIQFAIGVWVNHEVMPMPRWIGFGLVWVALVVLTVDSLRAARPRPLLVEPEIMD